MEGAVSHDLGQGDQQGVTMQEGELGMPMSVCVGGYPLGVCVPTPEVPLPLGSLEQEKRVWRRHQEPGAPWCPRRRDCVLTPCMRPGPASSTLILRLQKPLHSCRPPPLQAGGWGPWTLSWLPSPVMLHDLCACLRQDGKARHLVFGGQGSLEPSS